MTLHNVGWCLMEMQRYGDALVHLKQSLEICRNISLDERKEANIDSTLNNAENRLKNLQRFGNTV